MTTPDHTVDTVVVGAGVVGLAVARHLAARGAEVLVLEANAGPGEGISARSSEVIHAGLYYPPGTLKARLCVAGREALYAYLAERALPHRRTGKLVVAVTAAELPRLAALARQATANGVTGLEMLHGADLARKEPALTAAAALWVPHTGILDTHQLLLALQGDAEAEGALVVPHSPVIAAEPGTDGGAVLAVGGAEPMRLGCRQLVNAAGLGAIPLARSLHGADAPGLPTPFLAKGQYFALQAPAPFSHLIYPLPEDGGLGVHLTFDLAGRVRFGPDVTWVETPDLTVDPTAAPAFAASIRRWWPDLPEDALTPDYAGVRPKIVGPGDPAADFRVDGPAVHGLPGVVHLFGIESPGLTACLALAEAVGRALEGQIP